MRPVDFFHALRGPHGLAAAVSLLMAASASLAYAGDDRQPMILDTRTGIHDGKSGVVLQNAPLVQQPMVPTQPMATLPGLAPQAQPPIIVAPYIEIPGPQPAPPAVYTPRRRAAQ